MRILSRELHNAIRGEVRLVPHVSAFLEESVVATSKSGTAALHVCGCPTLSLYFAFWWWGGDWVLSCS